MFLWRGINIRPSHVWLLPSSTVKYLSISIQTQGSVGSFAVLVLKLCSFTTPSRGQEDVCTCDWCQQGKEKLFLWQQKNIHLLNTGCWPYTAIGWQIKGKYLCQDRTEVLTSLLKSTASGKGGRGLRWSESCGRTWQGNPTKHRTTPRCCLKIVDQMPFYIMIILRRDGLLGHFHLYSQLCRTPYIWYCTPNI